MVEWKNSPRISTLFKLKKPDPNSFFVVTRYASCNVIFSIPRTPIYISNLITGSQLYCCMMKYNASCSLYSHLFLLISRTRAFSYNFQSDKSQMQWLSWRCTDSIINKYVFTLFRFTPFDGCVTTLSQIKALCSAKPLMSQSIC